MTLTLGIALALIFLGGFLFGLCVSWWWREVNQ